MVSALTFFFVNIIKSDMAKSKQANKKKMVPKKASKKAAPKRNTGKKPKSVKKHQKKGKSTRRRKLRGGFAETHPSVVDNELRKAPIIGNRRTVGFGNNLGSIKRTVQFAKNEENKQGILKDAREEEEMRKNKMQKIEMQEEAARRAAAEEQNAENIKQDIIREEEIAAHNREVEELEAQRKFDESALGQLNTRVRNMLKLFYDSPQNFLEFIKHIQNRAPQDDRPVYSAPRLTDEQKIDQFKQLDSSVAKEYASIIAALKKNPKLDLDYGLASYYRR